MVWCWMKFCKIISQICITTFPIDSELTLPGQLGLLTNKIACRSLYFCFVRSYVPVVIPHAVLLSVLIATNQTQTTWTSYTLLNTTIDSNTLYVCSSWFWRNKTITTDNSQPPIFSTDIITGKPAWDSNDDDSTTNSEVSDDDHFTENHDPFGLWTHHLQSYSDDDDSTESDEAYNQRLWEKYDIKPVLINLYFTIIHIRPSWRRYIGLPVKLMIILLHPLLYSKTDPLMRCGVPRLLWSSWCGVPRLLRSRSWSCLQAG